MQQDTGFSWPMAGGCVGKLLGFLLGAVSAVGLRFGPRPRYVWASSSSVPDDGDGFTNQFATWFILRALAGTECVGTNLLLHGGLGETCRSRAPLLNGVVFSASGTESRSRVILLMLTEVAASSARGVGLGMISRTRAVIWRIFRPDGGAPTSEGQPPHRLAGNGMAIRYACALLRSLGFGYIIPATVSSCHARQLISDPLVFGWSWSVFVPAGICSPGDRGSAQLLVSPSVGF